MLPTVSDAATSVVMTVNEASIDRPVEACSDVMSEVWGCVMTVEWNRTCSTFLGV